MATKEIILDIEVNNKVAIENIVKLRKQMDELKVEQLALKGAYDLGEKSLEEYDRESAALEAQLRNVKSQIREYNKEIDNNIQKQEAQEGSLRQMRAELKNMVKEYDSLSAADRNSEVGVKMRNEIKDLTDQLKNFEGETGRFQRNVGDYRNAIQEALNGTIPLKTVLKELKGDIQTLSFQYRQYGDEIKNQKAALDQLANTIGTDTDEYKQQAQALADLEQKYKETGDAINNMQIAAGNISDTISDTNASIANFGKDNANIKAVSEGMGVLANSYSVVQAGMAAFGAESEDLIRIWAKIQVMQQGINAVNQIAAALEKESVLRQQLRVVVNRLLGKSMEATAAAKQKDAAASVEAAAGDAALAAGETAATAAAGGLTVALKAVGAAIKSIPVVGWILAAVAALTTLTGLIIKHNREEKKNNQLYIQRKELMEANTKAHQEALEATQKQVVQLDMAISRLKSTKSGTEEWKKACTDVATELGVDAEWLQKNVDKVDDLRDAWVKLKIAMAMTEAYAKQYADKQLEIQMARMKIEKILKDETATDRERWKAIQEELNLTKKQAKELRKLYDDKEKAQKKDEKTRKAAEKAYNDYVKGIVSGLEKEGDAIGNMMNEAATAQYEAQDVFDNLTEGATNAGTNAGKTITKEVKKTAKELNEELEDLIVEGLADGIQKQIKEVEKASKRWIEKMKEARDKDLENKDLYDKLIEEKEKQTQAKVDKIRDEGYSQLYETAQKLTSAYEKLWSSAKGSQLGGFKNTIKDIRVETEEAISEINNLSTELKKSAKDLKLDLVTTENDFFGNIYKLLNLPNDELELIITTNFQYSKEDAKKFVEKFKTDVAKNFIFDDFLEVPVELKLPDENGELKETNIGMLKMIEYFKNMSTEGTKVSSVFENLTTQYKNFIKASNNYYNTVEKATEAEDKYVGSMTSSTIVMRKQNAEMKSLAKSMQDILLEQAERGALGDIPDTISSYIEYQIEELEDQYAKLFDKIEKSGAGATDEESAMLSEIKLKIESLNKALAETNRLTELEKRELQLISGEGLTFFDNTELLQNQIEIDKLKNKTQALYMVKEQGQALEERLKVAREQNNTEEIERIMTEMAAIGYTSREEIEKTIASMEAQEMALAKNTKKIWMQTAHSVVSSFQTVINSFSDLMNEIGEDNAGMTNFLEGLAYVNIGVNLAVAISEAVASGAGMPFPYNLAAIASAVAAVVAAIASAISTYKQYHKNVSSPKFATGGVIGGRTAKTKEEGRRDDISILASRGEYIINADKVKEYGIEFFDAINFGKKMRKLNISGKYADGGVINQTTIQQVSSQTPNYDGLVDALQQMPNPIVSVAEITNKQKRVQVKEKIATSK